MQPTGMVGISGLAIEGTFFGKLLDRWVVGLDRTRHPIKTILYPSCPAFLSFQKDTRPLRP